MNGTYTIAEVSRRSGFVSSTLRYYEDLGLVRPAGRTEAGYRLYDDGSLARLAFISRAKQLGCTLDEISDLLTAWEGERCEPVQTRLRLLVAAKLGEAQERIAELVAFAAELQEAAAVLGRHTPDGPCDDDCGCSSPAGAAGSGQASSPAWTAVPLTPRPVPTPRPAPTPPASELVSEPPPSDPAERSEPPMACSLDPGEVERRSGDWRAALADVVAREALEGGVRLVFPAGTPVGPLAELAAAEQACCAFFGFALTVDGRGPALEVTAPAGATGATGVLASMFGVPG